MSEQREVAFDDGVPVKELTREQKVAKLAAILERGFTNHRLQPTDLPKDLHGEWQLNDPTETARMKALGFVDGSKYVGETPHMSADGAKLIGDVRYWVCPKDHKELIDEAVELRKRDKHSKTGKQIEERNFTSAMHANSDKQHETPPVVESTINEVGATEIVAATQAGGG